MARFTRTAVFAALTAAGGCGHDPAESQPSAKQPPPSTACAAGERDVAGKGCVPAGTQDDGCAAGQHAMDGGCQPAGVPPNACAPGFQSDATGGCAPVLPADTCPSGTMAIPGDAQCRAIAPCGTGAWGDIPVDGTTQYVDASYAAGSSDGTSARPWTSIQQAVTAAAPGAIVAVAQGSYVEAIDISSKAVRLWGRCPALVDVLAAAGTKAAIAVMLANGTELHAIAVHGPTVGLYVSGSKGVLLDHVWVHDVDSDGVELSDADGAAEATVRDSLVERAGNLGVQVLGSTLTLERSSVRTALAPFSGAGIRVGINTASGGHSTATIQSSVIEANTGAGVFIPSSDATIEASVIRGTVPQSDGIGGYGIVEQAESGNDFSNVTVRSSVVSSSRGSGILVIDSNVDVEATTIVGTRADADATTGVGVGIVRQTSTTATTATVDASLVEDNQAAGIFVDGTSVEVTASIVRATRADAQDNARGYGIRVRRGGTATVRTSVIDKNVAFGVGIGASAATLVGCLVTNTLPLASDGNGGHGIDVEDDLDTGVRGSVTVQQSVIDGNHDGGVVALGSDLSVESTLVRNTQPNPTFHGRGIGIGVQRPADSHQPATGSIRASVVDHSELAGLLVIDADATVETSIVRNTIVDPSEKLYGDSIAVMRSSFSASLSLVSSRVEQSARAGLSVFSATAALRDVTLECNAIQLDGENTSGQAAALTDLGGNVCDCGGKSAPCEVQSSGLAPPPPL